MESSAFLIDTQIFIWWMEKSKRLSQDHFQLLNSPQYTIFFSVASVWEIVLKIGKKKLQTPPNIEEGIKASSFSLLSIELSHVLGIEELPFYHSDPFDRLLIAQAKAEKLTFITADEKIWRYDLPLIKV